MMAIAVAAALASACLFALSNSLQHRAASADSTNGLRTGRLFRALVARPSWHAGVIVGALAFTLHAVAVGNGPLIVVQPLVVTGIVLAVPLRAALDRKRPAAEDVRWVALTATGIAVFVIASDPVQARVAIRESATSVRWSSAARSLPLLLPARVCVPSLRADAASCSAVPPGS